ncbi:uncharacterized protein LOC119733047 [Patiria miniata]|uniref:Alpha-type protein kinase domain-containing protein n=1 Tax=Patiria miniata TaxID=46514 RepID=A0A914AGB3_PATMI|nr:uncharacterized protein LOC119733047 [Patiria miniata]
MGNAQSHTSEPFTLKGEDVYAKFENDWFAKGESRYAYRGRIKHVNRWWFERGEQCVVKLYKEEYCNRLKEDAWKADNRASAKAGEMAMLFNSAFTNKGFAKIEILSPIISKVKTFATYRYIGRDSVPQSVRGPDDDDTKKANQMVPEGAAVAIERFLQGQYVHFLSNSAKVNQNEKTLVPVAFSHFTYAESNGEILVTDLQGVYNGKNYIFTDPAVHSMEKHGQKFGHYGPTDLGMFGVVKFFQNHECNRLCRELLKPDMSKIPDYLKGDLDLAIEAIRARSGSTYTYALLESGLSAQRIQELHTSIAHALTQSGDGQRRHYGFRAGFINVLA